MQNTDGKWLRDTVRTDSDLARTIVQILRDGGIDAEKAVNAINETLDRDALWDLSEALEQLELGEAFLQAHVEKVARALDAADDRDDMLRDEADTRFLDQVKQSDRRGLMVIR